MNSLIFKRTSVGVLLVFILTACSVFKPKEESVQNEQRFPKPEGVVSDFENILTNSAEAALELTISDHAEVSGDEIAIVTTDTLWGYDDIISCSLALANEWGVGKKDKNNGVVIFFSARLREIRVQNGDGITSRLTDDETQVIIDEYMIEHFKTGAYYDGLQAGLDQIILHLQKLK